MPSWKSILQDVLPGGKCTIPATTQDLNDVEHALKIRLPDDLRLLLSETNGVKDREYGYDHLWSTQRIMKENREFQDHLGDWGPAYQSLTFFADAGNGDNFGFLSNSDAQPIPSDIYVWDHDDDSIRQIAPTFREFIEGWFSGKLTI